MKFCFCFALVLGVVAKLQAVTHASLGQQIAPHRSLALTAVSGPQHYGDTLCPCIGFDNVAGDTSVEVELDEGEKVDKVDVLFPADLGARCEAWDSNTHPYCKAGDKSDRKWCAQQWCYVDPCRCDLNVLPKLSEYLSEVTYRGKPLFYSYATCGGEDMFATKVPQIGNSKCRCIGFDGLAGTTEVQFKDGALVEYPAEIGGTCRSWDLDRNPECKGDKVPSWCKSNWCYVDPCECSLPGGTVPKISAYLPKATFTGKNLYYSYETCGSPDTWTEKYHTHACVNQETKEQCAREPRCAWSKADDRCLGRELVNHPLCVKPDIKSKDHAGTISHKLPSLLVIGFTVAAIGAGTAHA